MDNFSEIDKIYHQISSSHTRDLIRHFMYSIKDINSYDELTEEEKKIVSEDTYNKFRVVKPITIEEAAKNIKRYTPQQREIVEEVAELKKKLKELDKFIKSPEYVGGDFPEKQRIAKQYSIMNGYLNILGERINNFVI